MDLVEKKENVPGRSRGGGLFYSHDVSSILNQFIQISQMMFPSRMSFI